MYPSIIKFKSAVLSLTILACASPNPRATPSHAPKTADQVAFTRFLAIKTCYHNRPCLGPVVKDLEHSQVKLTMEPFSKGYEKGSTARDVLDIQENGIRFRSEIRVVKKAGVPKYYVYMMLRSGPTLGRHGKIKTFHIENLSDLTEMELVDDPIAFADGYLQAELIMDRPLPLTK